MTEVGDGAQLQGGGGEEAEVTRNLCSRNVN